MVCINYQYVRSNLCSLTLISYNPHVPRSTSYAPTGTHTSTSSSHPNTHKLQALSNCRPKGDVSCPPLLSQIVTPLQWQAWEGALRSYPDKQFARLIVDGLREGFRIGFNYDSNGPKSSTRNMRSAYEHPEVVWEYLSQEIRQGRILGPFPSPPIQHLHISSFGVIPKRHQQGKWRLIMDLSSPEGSSVNDGIDPSLCSLSYISIDVIAAAILCLGRGTLIAKTDIKHAYRQVPVHPQDRPLLGMLWKRGYYLDTVLPFGLRSAPLIFTAVADALEWIVQSRGVSHIFHYIDDFVILGPPNSARCQRDLDVLIQTCDHLGVLIASEKTEGPASSLTVLGIEIDTLVMELRLPAEKMERLRTLLSVWQGRRSGQRRDLESLVGMLQHASKVVRPGRIFLRRMYDVLAQTHHFKQHFTIRLNKECRADLEWWRTFIVSWNGTSILRPLRVATPDVHVWSDASGGWGCGAVLQGEWYQIPWGPLPISSVSIAPKELFPIVVAGVVWGQHWRGCTVCFHSDNEAVVSVINHQSARDPLLCHLMRCIFYTSAALDFDTVARHTPGVKNVAADALSRNNLPAFFLQVPRAAQLPTLVPLELQQGLSVAQPQWDSREWTTWFSSVLSSR